jgi:iron complex outermembrane receptor protein
VVATRRVNVTINGFHNDSESHGTYWVNMPISSLESVQLQRGVGTSTNGSGAFGKPEHAYG